MSIESENSIQIELTTISEGKSVSWLEIAELLMKISETKYWMKEEKSFNQWLVKNSDLFGVKPAMLRRRLKAAETLNRLFEALKKKDTDIPDRATLAESLGPERFELLEKLERVVSEDSFESIVKKTFQQVLTRDELKQLWADYRGVLCGQTAQGRVGEAPKVNINDERQFNALQRSMALEALKTHATTTRDSRKITSYERVFGNIYIPGNLFREAIDFLAVKVVKPAERSIEFHGYIYKRLQSKPFPPEKDALALCDYIWYVMPGSDLDGKPGDHAHKMIPSEIGLLEVRGNDLVKNKVAHASHDSAKDRNDLLSELFALL